MQHSAKTYLEIIKVSTFRGFVVVSVEILFGSRRIRWWCGVWNNRFLDRHTLDKVNSLSQFLVTVNVKLFVAFKTEYRPTRGQFSFFTWQWLSVDSNANAVKIRSWHLEIQKRNRVLIRSILSFQLSTKQIARIGYLVMEFCMTFLVLKLRAATVLSTTS